MTEYLIALQGTCTKVHTVFPGLSKEKFNALMAFNFNARLNILNEVLYYIKCNFEGYTALNPSSIYSWSIGHILEHDFFCLGHLGCAGSKEKKVDLRNSEQLLRVVFSTF